MDVIRQVRSRWRTRLLIRGAVVVVGGALVALAIASWGLQQYRFSPASVTWFRVSVFTVFALLVGFWFVRPLRRRVTDLQVALYLEEHEPQLQAAILSAVDVSSGTSKASGEDVPAIIVDRMVEHGETVIVEGHVESKRTDGSLLQIAFCDIFDMRDGKIQKLSSYLMQTSK